MINYIEHLWQFEVKNCRILPSVIKVQGEQAKAYFYSETQQRVLRKKEYSAASLASVLQIQEMPNQMFLAFEISEKNVIVPRVVLENQVMELAGR